MTALEALQKQFLTFSLAGEEYAVPVLRVKEILEFESITRVPKTPACVRGVFNLRGNVVPVIDLATKFGLGTTAHSRTTCIIILEVELETETRVMGIIVDSVSEVVDITAKDIEPVPAFGTSVHLDYLSGMMTMGRGFALLLDIDKALSLDELNFAQQAEMAGVEDSASDSAVPVEAAVEYIHTADVN